ncbi:MAG TPA: LLM class flavin-dependent oxidoreductase [Polyangia bacterium]|jgi:luciferase family oxidoreductase group 1|nr:LLM class flavin-dependent oxidoreductase [Polyangia bacterium]
MSLPLSVLDLVPLGRGYSSADALRSSVELARSVEALGYARLWYAEHHNMPGIATTTPEIMIAHVAHQTSHIRLGAGGVMLPNHSPLKVAESYRLLEALAPGRIDLGIGRAPGTDGLTALALRRSRAALGADDFVEQLDELRGYGAGTLPPSHPFARIHVMPDDVPLPPVWLLGSSDYSARLAAELGLGFAFAGHFSPDPPAAAMRLYRQRFVPGALQKPHAILALSVFCADSDSDAERMSASMRVAFAELRAGRPGRLPSPDDALAHVFSPDEQAALAFYRRVQIVGTPERVRAQIEARAHESQADEVMVATHAYEASARLRSYELVAQAFAGSMSAGASGIHAAAPLG